MRVVLYGAGLGFLFFVGYLGLLLAAMHLHERRRRNLAVKAPQREATAREYPSTPVEELSPDELAALYELAVEEEEKDRNFDLGLFATEMADPVLVESTIEWVVADATEKFLRSEGGEMAA